jgi:DNA-directed RNA polymerase alpha subunit
MPLDNEDLNLYSADPKLSYTVNVAPDSVLNGAFSEFPAYVLSLKDMGIKNNFDYEFNPTLEKRNRYLKKYKDIVNLNLPPRALKVFTDAGITTVKEIQDIPIRKLRTIPNLGERTVQELIAALGKNNIKLQEEESNVL